MPEKEKPDHPDEMDLTHQEPESDHLIRLEPEVWERSVGSDGRPKRCPLCRR